MTAARRAEIDDDQHLINCTLERKQSCGEGQYVNPGGRRAIYIATTIKIIDSSCTCVHRKGIYHNLVYNIKFV